MKSIFNFKLILLIALVFSGSGIFAQASIGFSSSGLLGMPDTAYSSSNTIQVQTHLQNFDSTGNYNYADTVQIVGYIDTGAFYIPFALPPISNFTLPSGDSATYLLPLVFLDNQMGGNFRIGNNVIVIWPVCYDQSFATHDSISVNIFILDPNSVQEYHKEKDDIRFYPVPASGPLYVTTGAHSTLHVKQVVVRDATGKIVTVSDTPSLGIKTDDWASGIYMLEITFDNGQKSNYKIIR